MQLNEKIEREIRMSCEEKNVPPDLVIQLVKRWLSGALNEDNLGDELKRIYLQIDGNN